MKSQNSPLHSIKPSFLKKLIKSVKKKLNYIEKKTHADKRFKTFFAVPHFLILMGFQLTMGSSLREIVTSLGLGSRTKHLLGINTISSGPLSRMPTTTSNGWNFFRKLLPLFSKNFLITLEDDTKCLRKQKP